MAPWLLRLHPLLLLSPTMNNDYNNGETAPLLSAAGRPKTAVANAALEAILTKSPRLGLPLESSIGSTGPQPLQTKRIAKTSRPRKAIAEFRKKGRHVLRWTGRIGVHVKVDEIDIEMLAEKVLERLPGWEAIDFYDALRLWQVEPPYIGHDMWSDWPMSEDEGEDGEGGGIDMEAAKPEIYVFSFGVVIFYNFPSQEFEEKWLDENILGRFPDCYGHKLVAEEVESASDEMAFIYGEKFTLRRDVATLATRESGEKLAVAFALAKSSLLSVYEERVQKTIERNSHIPDEMVKSGRLHMTRQEISKEVGRMLLVKHGINLDQSLIDTPEGMRKYNLKFAF